MTTRRCSYPHRVQDPALVRQMTAYLTARQLSPTLAQWAGWYPTVVGECPRIVIPAPWSDGTPYWQARAMVEHPVRYLSPAAERGDGVVVVSPVSQSSSAWVAIAEGPMDALALAEHGCVGIALMGNRPSPVVWARVASLARGHRVMVVPDADAVPAAGRWMVELAKRGVSARLAVLPGKDFSDLSRAQREEVVSSWTQ